MTKIRLRPLNSTHSDDAQQVEAAVDHDAHGLQVGLPDAVVYANEWDDLVRKLHDLGYAVESLAPQPPPTEYRIQLQPNNETHGTTIEAAVSQERDGDNGSQDWWTVRFEDCMFTDRDWDDLVMQLKDAGYTVISGC